MKVIETDIPDVKIIEPKVFGDDRGFFLESWNKKIFVDLGIEADFVQDNHSRSVKNTLRGLHYQIEHSQGKLVRVTRGAAYDVAVDLRKYSPTFGQWVGEALSENNRRMLWIPPGFAHGFYTTTDDVEFQYKCTDYYFPASEKCLIWNDVTLGINWPFQGDPILSEKDAKGLSWGNIELFE